MTKNNKFCHWPVSNHLPSLVWNRNRHLKPRGSAFYIDKLFVTLKWSSTHCGAKGLWHAAGYPVCSMWQRIMPISAYKSIQVITPLPVYAFACCSVLARPSAKKSTLNPKKKKILVTSIDIQILTELWLRVDSALTQHWPSTSVVPSLT